MATLLDCVEVRFKRKDFTAILKLLSMGDIAVVASPGHDIGIVT
jgi:hypothetical protein